MSVLTLVRHGQASYMSDDYDRLSNIGEEQSRRLAQYWLKTGYRCDAVFTGPAKRHRRTAELVTEGASLPQAVTVDDLDEFDAFQLMKRLGPVLVERDAHIRQLNREFEERRHTPEGGRALQKLFEAAARRWCGGEFDTDDIESWPQFRARVGSAIDQIRRTSRPASNIAVFTSAGPIAATIASALDLAPLKAIEFVWLSRNCSYSEFLFSGDRFSLGSFNSIPHLDEPALITFR